MSITEVLNIDDGDMAVLNFINGIVLDVLQDSSGAIEIRHGLYDYETSTEKEVTSYHFPSIMVLIDVLREAQL